MTSDEQSAEEAESGLDASALVRDVVEFRTTYVNGYVERRINHREGDFTDEQYEHWWREAHETWRRQYPAFAGLLPSVLPEEDR